MREEEGEGSRHSVLTVHGGRRPNEVVSQPGASWVTAVVPRLLLPESALLPKTEGRQKETNYYQIKRNKKAESQDFIDRLRT